MRICGGGTPTERKRQKIIENRIVVLRGAFRRRWGFCWYSDCESATFRLCFPRSHELQPSGRARTWKRAASPRNGAAPPKRDLRLQIEWWRPHPCTSTCELHFVAAHAPLLWATLGGSVTLGCTGPKGQPSPATRYSGQKLRLALASRGDPKTPPRHSMGSQRQRGDQDTVRIITV